MNPKALACLMGLSAILGAADWDPIPASAWAIKEGPKGAVVLEDRLRFTRGSVEHLYRARIFAETGRGAAEFQDLPILAYDIKGRTIYPDGRSVAFNSRKDFAERKLEGGGLKQRQTHLIAPGVTSDCVVELRWTERANGELGGLPKRLSSGYYAKWFLGNPYPTETLTIELAWPFPLAWQLNPGLLKLAAQNERGSMRSYTFRKVPAMEAPPYALRPTLQWPFLVLFYQPDVLGRHINVGPESYWQEAVSTFFKDDYEDSISKGGAFKVLAEELTRELPKEPQAAAKELLARLNQRIANLSMPTHAEKAGIPKDFFEDLNPKELAKAAKLGQTSGRGMRLLYYHLLKAANLSPKIAKVPDRDEHVFSWADMNPFQFDRDLIGVEESGKGTLWLDPALRFATPGILHPDFTWVPALIFDSISWKPTRGNISAQNASGHQVRHTYTLTLEEDADRFELASDFTGYPEFNERFALMDLDPSEQAKRLKERFEKRAKNLLISHAEARNATDPRARLHWELKGSLEREGGRRRDVDPFPGMAWPLNIPSHLDATRITPIVLPHPLIHQASSSFAIPKGYKLELPAEFQKENYFGRVQWIPSLDPATGRRKVSLRVELSTNFATADKWGAFKEYLGWVEEACRKGLVLTKEG